MYQVKHSLYQSELVTPRNIFTTSNNVYVVCGQGFKAYHYNGILTYLAVSDYPLTQGWYDGTYYHGMSGGSNGTIIVSNTFDGSTFTRLSLTVGNRGNYYISDKGICSDGSYVYYTDGGVGTSKIDNIVAADRSTLTPINTRAINNETVDYVNSVGGMCIHKGYIVGGSLHTFIGGGGSYPMIDFYSFNGSTITYITSYTVNKNGYHISDISSNGSYVYVEFSDHTTQAFSFNGTTVTYLATLNQRFIGCNNSYVFTSSTDIPSHGLLTLYTFNGSTFTKYQDVYVGDPTPAYGAVSSTINATTFFATGAIIGYVYSIADETDAQRVIDNF